MRSIMKWFLELYLKAGAVRAWCVVLITSWFLIRGWLYLHHVLSTALSYHNGTTVQKVPTGHLMGVIRSQIQFEERETRLCLL